MGVSQGGNISTRSSSPCLPSPKDVIGTCDFVMRYLRTREDFFARQLAVMPPTIPNAWQDPNIRVLYHDGTNVATTVSALGSFLRLRSWIFDLVALDLHLLTQKGHFKSVNELLVILFGSGAYDDSPSWEADISQPFREIGQSHLKIIEFLRGLVFEWSDTLNVQPVDLRFLSQLNLKSCLRVDTNGCEVVDRSALLVLLNDARHALHTQGHIVSPAQNEQLNAEIQYVLESSAVENHRLQITYATAVGYESWRRLLSMVLTKCFDRLPSTQRESTLFDLMQVLPNIIRSPDIQESTAVLLSETVLSSITKLREDRQNDTSGVSGTNSLPVERLFVIVRGILDCIIEGGRLELVRGNLYAALINYVHMVTSLKAQFAGLLPSSGSKPLSVSVSDEDAFAISRRSLSTPSTSLEAGSLALMKHAMDRLISTISRDAIDGAEVVKYGKTEYSVKFTRSSRHSGELRAEHKGLRSHPSVRTKA
ncbi:Nucleoporin [Salix suchowensis]|nr:Nucleoporin [Salix suchowensis]